MSNRVKEFRKLAGLTQEQLAGQIGSNKSTISDLESGKFKPGLDLAHRISGALGETVYTVFLSGSEK